MVALAFTSAVGLALCLWWLVGAYRARRRVYALFEINPRDYRLLASDLGGRQPLFLRYGHIEGAADALFISRRGREGIIGEYKSRQHRGFVRRRERYQVTLYQGMFKRQRNLTTVSAVIRFADTTVSVRFDDDLFTRLVELEPEYRKARKRWRTPNPTPLHAR